MPAFVTGIDSTSPPFADMERAPHEAWVWEPMLGPEVVIPWSFSPSFDRRYPDVRHHDQVRLAFRTWEDAAVTPPGAQSYYRRDNVGWAEFGDLRSIMLHELGHILGFHHVEGALEHRFYTWDPGPGFLEGSANTSMVMAASGVQPGGYNHILSHDELLGVGLLYTAGVTTAAPRRLRFREVPFGDRAMLVVAVAGLSGPTARFAWGRATGFVRARVDDGRRTFRLYAGIVRINEEPPHPVGMRTRFDHFTYVPRTAGARIDQIELRTRGTNNPDALAVNRGPFSVFTTAPYGPDFKDDLLHTWSVPVTDTRDGVEFGLELDVYDWRVVEGSAELVDAAGARSRVSLPLATFVDFGIVDPDWAPEPPVPGFAVDPKRTIIARGIRIDGAGVVDKLAVARVTERNLLLADLAKKVQDRLQKEASPLDGLPKQLPLESVESGPRIVLFVTTKAAENVLKDAIVLDRPELLDEELLITARFHDERFDAEIVTVLGRGVPQPVGLEVDDRDAEHDVVRLSVRGVAGFDMAGVEPGSVRIPGARIDKVSVQGGKGAERRLIVEASGVGALTSLRLIGRAKDGAVFEGTLPLR